MKNNKEAGVLHFVVYQDASSKEYCGLCIELGLFDSSTDLEALKKNLADAARGYVRTVMKKGLSEDLLQIEPTQDHIEILKKSLSALQPMQGADQGVYSTQISVFNVPTPGYAHAG
jgi:hypothetical protein